MTRLPAIAQLHRRYPESGPSAPTSTKAPMITRVSPCRLLKRRLMNLTRSGSRRSDTGSGLTRQLDHRLVCSANRSAHVRGTSLVAADRHPRLRHEELLVKVDRVPVGHPREEIFRSD